MKTLLLSLFLTVINAQSFAQIAPKSNSDTIKVISYNIWNGFEWGKEKERETRFVEYIINEDPDILALQELCGFTQEQLSKLAKRWGHNYAVIQKEEGYPVGITSKTPIKVINKMKEGYWHGIIHVETYGYDLLVAHLNPFDYKKRLIEANNTLDYMTQKNLTKNTIVLGDLNAHSPFDAAFLEKHSTDILKGRKDINQVNGNFDYSVISRFLSYPLIDVCQKQVDRNRRETYPTLIFWSKDKSISDRNIERLDYILVTTDLENKISNAYIPNRGGVDYLSDHYPVVMNLVK